MTGVEGGGGAVEVEATGAACVFAGSCVFWADFEGSEPGGTGRTEDRCAHSVSSTPCATSNQTRCWEQKSETGMNLECSSIFCNLTAFLVVVQSVEENKLQVFVHDQRVLVLVCVQLLSDTIDGPRFWDDLWRCTTNR